MSIIFATEEQKRVMPSRPKYTRRDLIEFSLMASSMNDLAEVMLAYSLDTNNCDGMHRLTGAMNIMAWLTESISDFVAEVESKNGNIGLVDDAKDEGEQ